MQELTADNALPYLREHGLVGSEPAQVELLGWGVSNVVLRVQAGGAPVRAETIAAAVADS